MPRKSLEPKALAVGGNSLATVFDHGEPAAQGGVTLGPEAGWARGRFYNS